MCEYPFTPTLYLLCVPSVFVFLITQRTPGSVLFHHSTVIDKQKLFKPKTEIEIEPVNEPIYCGVLEDAQ
jgi:hypothetical protein